MPSVTSRASLLAGGVLAGLVVLTGEAVAQVPDFYMNGVGWYGVGDFIAVRTGYDQPVVSAAEFPDRTGDERRATSVEVVNEELHVEVAVGAVGGGVGRPGGIRRKTDAVQRMLGAADDSHIAARPMRFSSNNGV